MVKASPILQPAAFSLPEGSSLRCVELAALPFPTAWHGPLERLQAELRGRQGLPNTPLVDRLNSCITALTPNLLTLPAKVRTATPWQSRFTASNGSTDGAAAPEGGSATPIQPWLLSHEPISTDELWLVVLAWLEQTYGECESYGEVKGLLKKADLQWQTVQLEMLGHVSDNNTAHPDGLAYGAVPALIADLLVRSGVEIPIGRGQRRLVRVPSKNGAELLTWPPAYHSDNKQQEWGYSYRIGITLQNVPQNPAPRIHFHYGVRRWLHRPLLVGDQLYMPRGETSVYIRSDEMWSDETGAVSAGGQPTFAVARLRAGYDGDRRVPVWRDGVPDIARRLEAPFPDGASLARDPMSWLHGVGGVSAGVVYPKPFRNHPIKPGLGLDKHEDITNALAAALQGELELHAPLQRVSAPNTVSHPLRGELRDLPAEDRLMGLEKSVGQNVRIEIYYTTERGRDMLVDRVRAVLTEPTPQLVEQTLPPTRTNRGTSNDGVSDADSMFDTGPLSAESDTATYGSDQEGTLDPGDGTDVGADGLRIQAEKKLPRRKAEESEPDPAPDGWSTALPGGGHLRVVPVPLGTLGATLTAQPGDDNFKGLIKRGDLRAEEIARQLTPAPQDEPTLALIELPNYQDPRKPELRKQYRYRDPKRALRKGMARSGRVTQFISPEEDGLRHRADKAVRDGLRQLGYLPAPIGFRFKSGEHQLPAEMVVAGVYVLNLTRKRTSTGVHLPVVVLMHTGNHQVRAWLPDGKGTRPYRQALLDVAEMPPEKVKVGWGKYGEALSALQQFLRHELPLEGAEDMVVLAMAQNARQTWPGLGNAEMIQDCIQFDRVANGGHPVPLNELEGRMRLIRLRTGTGSETPEYYVPDSKANTSSQGVWCEAGTPRLFFNTASKPNTSAAANKGKDKYPTERYAVPSIVEVIPIALQPEDKPELWASAVNQWRDMSILFNDMTLLPLPLALARKMDEYAEVIGPKVLHDESLFDYDEDEEDETQAEQMEFDFAS
jgi:hypothetical protein